MHILISFIVVFLITYLFYLFFVILRKNKVSKIKNCTESLFLKKRFKLKMDKISDKKLANIIAITNASIIATTFCIIEFVENYILKIMFIFVTLMVLIFAIYTIIGKILQKKEGK